MQEFAHRLREGLTYDAYRARWQARLRQPTRGLDPAARRVHFYRVYNDERARRVHAGYVPSDALREALAAVDEPQTWMVLTEDWCADSAYNLPVVAEAAALSPVVDLRILDRDAHLDVMDRYLTNGGRSIPKLVAFDASGAELFTWGPRPEEARALRERLAADGLAKQEVSSRLMDWYEEGGWRRVDAELVALVEETLRAA